MKASNPLRRLVIASAIVALTLPVLADSGTVTLTFNESSVTVSGVTPGGDVAFFAVMKEPSTSFPPIPVKSRQAVILHDDNHAGQVTFQRTRKLPAIAVWIAVDVTTGQWAASGSPAFVARAVPTESFAPGRDSVGQLRKLVAQLSQMDVLLVRPGTGAWYVLASKTSLIDENGTDPGLQIDVSQMQPLASSLAPLAAIQQHDIIAVVDAGSMGFTVEEVGQ